MAIKNLSAIEKTLKLPEGTLKKALESSDELEVNISDVVVHSKTEYEDLKNNLRGAGIEIGLKKISQELGVDAKDPDAILKHITEARKADIAKALEEAKMNPDKRVAELSNDLEKIKAEHKQVLEQKTKLESDWRVEKETSLFHGELMKHIPAENLVLPREKVLKNLIDDMSSDGISYEINSGNVLFKDANGVIKDNILNPVKADSVLNKYLTNYVKQVEGGSGAGDSGTGKGKPGTLDSFNKTMETKGIKQSSADYNREMQKAISEKTLVV